MGRTVCFHVYLFCFSGYIFFFLNLQTTRRFFLLWLRVVLESAKCLTRTFKAGNPKYIVRIIINGFVGPKGIKLGPISDGVGDGWCDFGPIMERKVG